MFRNVVVVVAMMVGGSAMAHSGVTRFTQPARITAPTRTDLKQYLVENEHQAKLLPVSGRMCAKLNTAMQDRAAFTRITLGPAGPDHGSVAYVPAAPIKGLPSNTAFIARSTIAGEFWYRLSLPNQ